MRILFFIACFLCFILPSTLSSEPDVTCLKGVKKSLSDPSGRLSSWIFGKEKICDMDGVSCWNQRETRVLKLQLPDSQLAGQIPDSLQYCPSLQVLDLSANAIFGGISPQLCNWVPYVVNLDLSNNELSGPIPNEIGNCKFLNSLVLTGNRLSGSIPYGLGRLQRMKVFSVANNKLSGPIPSDIVGFGAANFEGNNLCGAPLGKCGGHGGTVIAIIIFAGVIAAIGSLLLGFLVWLQLSRHRYMNPRGVFSHYEKDDNGLVQLLKKHRLANVTLFHNPISKLRVGDLVIATGGFATENVVIYVRTGLVYKAALRDGSVLAIKRLTTSISRGKRFEVEATKLGQVRHPNLVPLLGFFSVENERFLISKHMPDGSLHDLLHGTEDRVFSALDWPTRARIGVGIAKGLAWLHHGCNPPCIHCHLCSSIVLLDDDLDARITDFGLAKLAQTHSSGDDSISDHQMAEVGYLAPECSSTMVATQKADIYSFGVVLLELLTRKKPAEIITSDEGFKGNLVDWVQDLAKFDRTTNAVDGSLLGKGNDEEIAQFLTLALRCVSYRPDQRPSMFQVCDSLKCMSEKYGLYDPYNEFPLTCNAKNTDNK